VRKLEGDEHSGVLIVDDTIEEKPYTDESELISADTMITVRGEPSKASSSLARFTGWEILPSRWLSSSWSRKPRGSLTKNGASGRGKSR
jgi:hypothetical protein